VAGVENRLAAAHSPAGAERRLVVAHSHTEVVAAAVQQVEEAEVVAVAADTLAAPKAALETLAEERVAPAAVV